MADFRIDVTKVNVYLKQIILWVRVLIVSVLVLTLGTVMLWNFFAPTTKDVSDRGSTNLVNAINSQNIAGLLSEWESDNSKTIPHISTIPDTSTIAAHGKTPE